MSEKFTEYVIAQGPWAVALFGFVVSLIFISGRAGKFLSPLVNSFFQGHAEFLVSVKTMGEKLVLQQEQLTSQQTQQTALMTRQTEQLENHAVTLDQHSEWLQDHGKKLEEISRVVKAAG